MAVQCVHRLTDANGTFLAYLATSSILAPSLHITFSQHRIDAIEYDMAGDEPDDSRGRRVTVTFHGGKDPETFWMKLVPLPLNCMVLERPDHL